LADKSASLMLEGLQRAAAAPLGLPLHASRTATGLFSGTSPGRKAAELCKHQGLLHVVGRETKGKSTVEVCALTDKGRAYLLEQVGPRPVLEALLQAIEARRAQVDELTARTGELHADLLALKATAEKFLDKLHTPPPAQQHANGTAGHHGPAHEQVQLVDELRRWQASGALGDYPLPDLFRTLSQDDPALTIGRFHDLLRQCLALNLIYLHPWTGPLYEIPQPAYALLAGHEVAYYVSLRR